MEGTQNNGSALPRDLTHMQEQAEQQLQAAREALTDLDKKVRVFVKENPGLCIVGAVAAGFIIGRIVARR